MSKNRSQQEADEVEAMKVQRSEATDQIARDTMTGDLRDCLLDFLKNDKNPLPWNLQGESSQRETIEKVERAVRHAVERCVRIIASEARSVIVAKLEQVTVKDGFKAVVSLSSKSDPLRHELVDAQGQEVLLVVSGSDPFSGERSPVEVQPDQHVLSGTDEDDEGSVFDRTPSGRG